MLEISLLTCGLRLPLPRKSWYTQAYAKEQGLAYRHQVELVEELVRWPQPLLPSQAPLVVLADSYLGASRLLQLCRQQGWTLITKLSKERTFADAPGQRVVAYGQSLAEGKFRRCRLCRGREATAAYRRQPPRKARVQEIRVYDYYSERRQVYRAGEVQVVYSWKTPAYTQQPNFNRHSFAVLLTNNLRLTTRQVVEYYELRWRIEVFFRELKGRMGLQDYQGTQFGSYERYVTLALLGSLMLEDQRLRGLKGEVAGPDARGRPADGANRSVASAGSAGGGGV